MNTVNRIILIIFLLVFKTLCLNAQNYEITYGPVLGLNTSFMDSKVEVLYDRFYELDRNIDLSKSTTLGFGYQAGVFVSIKPVESKFSLETNVIVASFNNEHTVKLYYEGYYATPWRDPYDNWMPEEDERKLKNELTVISIPLTLGYTVLNNWKYKLGLLIGATTNLNIKNDFSAYNQNFEEEYLYNDFYMSYHAGIKAESEKIICILKYDRSINIQEGDSKTFFTWDIAVDGLYLNSINLSMGYKLN